MPRIALILTIFISLLAIPAVAGADQRTVDFETGPALGTPVNDDYLAGAFVTFPQGLDFRPYRREVSAGEAHSGTVVGDIGANLCPLESVGAGSDCELTTGHTTGLLTKTASSVSVFAGGFADDNAGQTVNLTAHRTDGSTVSSGDVPIDAAAGFRTPLSVQSPAGDIASFSITASTGDLGIDDLTMNYPANSTPDISVTAPSAVVPILQNRFASVPVTVTRLNGSTGPVHLTAANAPPGVTPIFVPDTLAAGDSKAQLELFAAVDAPPTDFNLMSIKISADPQGNPAVGPGIRETRINARVAAPYDLELGDGVGSSVALPDCSSVDVPVRVKRDIAFNEDVHVAASPPQGVTASVLPDETIAPGGGLVAERTIRLSRVPGAAVPGSVLIQSFSAHDGLGNIRVPLTRAPPTAALDTGSGLAPRAQQAGTRISITGNGFCPGTSVTVGNTNAAAPATVSADGHTLTFNIPRYATTGPVTIVPASGAPYPTTNSLIVNDVRNTDGFQFANYGYGTLSIDELTQAFGADDLFITVNPCWPFGSCRVNTGILDPIAAIDWGVLNLALRNSGGHCFGISRAVQELTTGHEPYRAFTTGNSVFSIPGPSGPGSFVSSYLDAEHALQGSDEFLHAWFARDKSLDGQLRDLQFAIDDHQLPIISIQSGSSGHAVIAYDERIVTDGVDIDVYDNNRPFTADELTNGGTHKVFEDASVIHINTAADTWSFDGWHGGGHDGTLFVAPESLIPANPSLPGLTTIKDALDDLVFGSANGAVKTVGASPGADYMPPLDDHATPGAAGWWVGRDNGKPLDATLQGVKDGTYSEAYTTPGFAGSVSNMTTAKGVRDTVTGRGDALTFAGGADRPLSVDLAQKPSSSAAPTWTATLDTHTSAHGSDSAGLSAGGTLALAHDGASTTSSFTLTATRVDGGPSTFASGPLTVHGGDHITATPVGRDLGSVKLRIRDRRGATTTRVVHNHATAPAHVKLSKPRLEGTTATVRVRISGLHGAATLGASLRLLKGKHAAAHFATAIQTGNGTRTITWHLPKIGAGHYRLVADARVVTNGARGAVSTAGASAHQRATVTTR